MLLLVLIASYFILNQKEIRLVLLVVDKYIKLEQLESLGKYLLCMFLCCTWLLFPPTPVFYFNHYTRQYQYVVGFLSKNSSTFVMIIMVT